VRKPSEGSHPCTFGVGVLIEGAPTTENWEEKPQPSEHRHSDRAQERNHPGHGDKLRTNKTDEQTDSATVATQPGPSC
jgi:hypothetical protein